MSRFTFSVTNTLDIKLFERLKAEFDASRNKVVDVGIPDGPTEAAGISLAMIGAVHEFGATINHPGGTTYRKSPKGLAKFVKRGEAGDGVTGPHVIIIPERPWLMPAIRDNLAKFEALNRVNLLKIMRGEATFDQALGQLGLMGESFAKQKIGSGPFTPLKPATIKRKGSSKPLIDTGNMLQSVTFALGEK